MSIILFPWISLGFDQLIRHFLFVVGRKFLIEDNDGKMNVKWNWKIDIAFLGSIFFYPSQLSEIDFSIFFLGRDFFGSMILYKVDCFNCSVSFLGCPLGGPELLFFSNGFLIDFQLFFRFYLPHPAKKFHPFSSSIFHIKFSSINSPSFN